jgi:dephospho-CoA kinase
MESAILYEAHLEHTVDRVVCVVAPEEVRIDRVVKRDSISKERAKQWVDAQIPQEEVAKRADAVIVNDGVEDVEAQIDKVLTLFGIKY